MGYTIERASMRAHVDGFTVDVMCFTKVRHHNTGRTSKDTEVYIALQYPPRLMGSVLLKDQQDTFVGIARQDPGVKKVRKCDKYDQIYAKRLATRRAFEHWTAVMSKRFVEYAESLDDHTFRDTFRGDDADLTTHANNLLHETFPRTVRRVAWHLVEVYMGIRPRPKVGRWYAYTKHKDENGVR